MSREVAVDWKGKRKFFPFHTRVEDLKLLYLISGMTSFQNPDVYHIREIRH